MSSFSVVGFGRVGSALARSLRDAGWEFRGAFVRSGTPEISAELERLGSTALTHGQPISGDVIFLTVSDAFIGLFAQEHIDQFESGATLVHCAGSLGLDVFDVARTLRDDLSFGAFHPLQTVPVGAPLEVFTGAYAGIESDSASTGTVLNEVAEVLGMTPVRVSPESRASYHIAAPIASNHVTALLAQIETLSAEIGIPFAAFEPLVNAAVHNTFERGAQAALTGPVSRGDVETVKRHLAALEGQSLDAYRTLARAALALVPNPADELRTILGA